VTRHEGDILRASGSLGGWLAACACGWCPDVVYPTAGEAATAVGRHVLDHNRQETTP
jgi:hypothetical protein